MNTTSNPELAASIDKEIRDTHDLTTETTYGFLIRRARTDDSTDFVFNMYQAVYWMLPKVTERTQPLLDEMMFLLDALDESYADLTENELLYRREQVMLVFEQANSLIRYEPTLAAQEAFNQAQSARASKLRATDEDVARRIAKAYSESKRDGTSYGMVKRLAREYNVSQTTIHNYIRKYAPVDIDK